MDPPVACAYRREARRLRCRLAGKSNELHRALQRLAQRHDAGDLSGEHHFDGAGLGRAPFGSSRASPMREHYFEQSLGGAPMPRKGRQFADNRMRLRPMSADAMGIPTVVLDHFVRVVEMELIEPVLRFSVRQRLLRQAGRLGIGRFHANLIIAAVQFRREQQSFPRQATAHKPTAWFIASSIIAMEAALIGAAWWFVHL